MNQKEKRGLVWAVSKNVLVTVVILAALILTCIMAKNTYDFFAKGLFADTGASYYLPGTEFKALDTGFDSEGVG